MLTEEKAKALVEYLNKDEARTKRLAEMDGEAAAKAVSADGLEITADELSEFASGIEEASNVAKSGELDENALESVSGGLVRPWLWVITPILPSILPSILPRRW